MIQPPGFEFPDHLSGDSGFDEALMGMKVNEEKAIVIPPEKAYGRSVNHSMAGKTLQFKLRVTNIRRP